jgi:hypothetical protein
MGDAESTVKKLKPVFNALSSAASRNADEFVSRIACGFHFDN